MFTGIVEDVGEVKAAEARADVLRVTIAARAAQDGLPVGGSIAVNGCCLTATSVTGGHFTCDLTQETLQRTASMLGRKLRLELV